MGGAGTGGTASTAIAAAGSAARALDMRAVVAHAEQNAQAFAALGQQAEQSKLLVRSPEDFRQVVQQLAEPGADTVFVNARTLANTLAQSGKPITTPAIEEQLQQAIEAGGDVVMPIGEFTQLLAQPELRSLADHARFDPYGPTAAEARLWQEQHGAQIGEEISSALQRQLVERENNAQAQAVYDNILGQLEQSGRFTKPVNRAYASLQRDFYATMAGRAGMSVQDFAAAYPLRIASDGFGAYDQAQETRRASFDPETNTIALLKSADLSSFLHESGHFWLETLADIAGRDNAPEQIRNDMQLVLQWAGVPDLATWQGMTLDQKRQHHEQFARGFEAYAFEGRAPSLQLQGIFSRFRAWLINIYKSLRALDVELTDEVRSVFDRMLASDQQIAEAAQIRSAHPLFVTKPAAMSEVEWLQYQAMGEEAVGNAMAQYQARRLKDLAARRTKDGKKAYKATLEQIKREVLLRPIYAVQNYLKTGTLPDGSKAGDPVKLSIPIMKEIYGEGADAPWRALPFGHNGMASHTGVHPDIVAEQFGFSSGDAMVREITSAPKLADVVKAESAQRFAEEYGDAYTAEGIQQAAEDELANESRGHQLVAELNVLRRTMGSAQLAYKAAKDYAERAIAGQPVKLARRTSQHAAAEARAAKVAENAFATGDIAKAAEAKRDQVLNNLLARTARHARDEVDAAIERTRQIFKPDSQIGKLRDMDLVNAARAILASHGLGNSDKPAAAYLESVKKNDPDTWAEVEPWVQDSLINPKDYRELSLEQFRGMIETVETLWHLSRRTRQVEIDGQLVERAEITGALSRRLEQLGQPYARLGYDKAITSWQDTKIGLLGWRAALRRVEPWVSAMDGNNPDGVFRKFIWQPISEAVGQYRATKAKTLQQYLNIVQGVQIPAGKIEAPELGYTFNSKAELLHAILHTGNESNMSKLMRGRNWGQYQEDGTVDTSAWQRFIARAARDGIVSKADYDFAQAVWDLLEGTKPAAQKAHRDMYGFYFNEVEAKPLATPFGTYRGGYVPAVTDPRIVTDAAINREAENVMGNNSFMFPSTGRGFTKGRVEGYAKPLLLDLGYLPAHIDKVLRFSYVESHIKDVARIVKSSQGFGQAMDGFDPAVRTDMLIPWLQRTATQRVETPSQGRGGRAADRFFHVLRTRTGLQIMTANVTNALQQITGLSSSALKVRPRYLRNALWQYVRQPKATTQAISDKSTFMAHRVTSQTMEIQQHIDDLLLDPSKYEKAKAFAQKHGYFLQAGMQNVVDVITWSGAYEQAIESGATEANAVRAADSAVRETQGSFAPEDVSRFETGTPFMRAFTMFYSYFNTQANLLGTELGLRRGAGRLLYVYTFGLLIPATLAEMIVRAAGGGFDDDDDGDVDLWDMLRIMAGAQGRFLAGMVPGAGPAVMAGINAFNDKWYDDRISTSPAVSAIESTVRAPHSIYKAIAEDGSTKRAVRDTLTAIGMLTGLPLAPLAKPLGYMADVNEGRTDPEGALDVARGLVTGR